VKVFAGVSFFQSCPAAWGEKAVAAVHVQTACSLSQFLSKAAAARAVDQMAGCISACHGLSRQLSALCLVNSWRNQTECSLICYCWYMTEKINLLRRASEVSGVYFNEKLLTANDHCLRLAVNEDRVYPWHRHNKTDEIFIVLEGRLRIEFEADAAIDLLPGDACCVAAGTIHRTHAIGRTVNLCIEADREDTEFMTAQP
jgi:mannose-6-phosphate isomerase-like protein (cupin superfamily)